MDELGLLHIRLAGIGGLDTDNQMGKIRITGLRKMDFVTKPGEVSFASEMGLWVIGRTNRKMSRRKHCFLAQTQLLFLPKIMLHPNLPQQLDVRQAREERRGCFLIERREQLRPISPDLFQKGLLLLSFGKS